MQATEFLNQLKNFDKAKLENVKGIGPNLIQSLEDFINSSRFEYLEQGFQTLESNNKGLNITQSSSVVQDTSSIFFGQKVVITGSFIISRDVIKSKIESLGGKVVSSISSKTNYLVCGQDAGSKLTDAQNLGIKIITDLDWMN